MKWAVAMALLLAGGIVAQEPDTKRHEELERQIIEFNLRGERQFERGEYREALASFEKVLAIYREMYPASKYPEGHAELAEGLQNVGAAHQMIGQFDLALQCQNQSLAMRRKLYPKSKYPDGHLELGMSLNNLAVLHRRRGDLPAARECYEEALAIYRHEYPPARFPNGHPDLMRCIDNFAVTLKSLAEYDRALALTEESLAARRRLFPAATFPDGHSQLAFGLANKADLLKEMGMLAAARLIGREALAMRRKLFPPAKYPDGHSELSLSLTILGSVHVSLGELDEARPLLEEALAMSRRLYPPTKYPNGHPDTAVCANRLAELHHRSGEHDRALPLFQEALALYRRLTPGKPHPEIAYALGNIASILADKGQFETALRLAEESLAMIVTLYSPASHPEGHHNLATAHQRIAALQMELRRPDEAIRSLATATEILRRVFGPRLFPNGHTRLASALNDYALAVSTTGDFNRSVALHRESAAMYERLFPEGQFPGGHIKLVIAYLNLGKSLREAGRPAEARVQIHRSFDIYRKLVDRLLAHASEGEARDLLATLPAVRDEYLGLGRRFPDSADECHRALWDTKAALTRHLEQRLQATRRRPGDLADRLADVRRRIEMVVQQPAMTPVERDRLLADLTDQQDKLERDLTKQLPPAPRRSAPEDLRARLPARTAFIDFVRIGRDFDSPRSYSAFVVIAGRPVTRVELGDAGRIDAAIRRWRDAIDARRESPAAAELADRVWKPVARALPDDTQTVFLAPEGDLGRLPFAALPDTVPGTVLLERYTFAAVPHGPFLLQHLADSSPELPSAAAMLALGDVDYGDGATYPRLPGTKVELASVRAVIGDGVTQIIGSEATAARLRRELPNARHAHLATHGFFDAERMAAERSRQAGQFRIGINDGDTVTGRRGIGARSPLAFNGLVTAGANRPRSDDPGVLTGESIVQLPLENLRLCVLSACETGLGELTEGEGTFGLVRAFHLAGCPNVVASLWKVHDAATAALMAKFYHELWVRKRAPGAALREAQLTIFRHPELIPDLAGDRGAPKFDKAIAIEANAASPMRGARADTRLWAAFVLSGTGK